ncbi:MAG: L-serine ammonia-lyase, iron-sulfur-dependent, subunit alpha [Butyrivibrio sp.]
MYRSLEEICIEEEKSGKPFWKVIEEDDCKEQGISCEESFERMRKMYAAMKSADADYDNEKCSASGLSGKDGYLMQKARENGTTICGPFIGKVMEKAIKMGESNACMKRIVAAPTAGSCGVIPAVFLTVEEEHSIPEDEMVKALYVAAGIGGVIASRAFLAGAEGGCQAEIGAASAMAAGGVAYLMHGNGRRIVNAAALSLKSLLGLVCDPVAGLVEVPCIKRNVMGAVNALTGADMSMAGIDSRVPPDEVIDAMRSVGKSIPEALRETGEGGLAATPSAVKITNSLGSL